MSIYLSTYLSTYLLIYLSTYLPIYLSTCLSVCLSVCLPIYLSTCLSVCLPIYLSVCLSTYLPIYLSTYLPIYLSTYLSIDLSIYLSIYRSIDLSIYLSIDLSIYVSISAGLVRQQSGTRQGTEIVNTPPQEQQLFAMLFGWPYNFFGALVFRSRFIGLLVLRCCYAVRQVCFFEVLFFGHGNKCWPVRGFIFLWAKRNVFWTHIKKKKQTILGVAFKSPHLQTKRIYIYISKRGIYITVFFQLLHTDWFLVKQPFPYMS